MVCNNLVANLEDKYYSGLGTHSYHYYRETHFIARNNDKITGTLNVVKVTGSQCVLKNNREDNYYMSLDM